MNSLPDRPLLAIPDLARRIPDENRIPVAVVGATGAVGQRLILLLDAHPWFRVSAVTASPRSAGRPYGDVVNWVQGQPIPAAIYGMTVETADEPPGVPIAFSALDASVAGPVETALAADGILVVSNARSHRMDPTVPLLVPEVNPDHLALLDTQSFPGGGGIVTNPNCSTIGLAMALAPLHRAFRVEAVQVTTLQAMSGAGMTGLPALAIHDNVVPFIAGEEEKLEAEPLKILGELERDAEGCTVRAAELDISAQCTRVPVSDGHLATLSVRLTDRPSIAEVTRALEEFRGPPQEHGLPLAPRRPIHVIAELQGPQPRRHAGLEGGMAVSIGRLRPCPVLDLRMVVLSHNTVRGAAGGSVLCAELALAEGRVNGLKPPVPVDDR
jgi:aspartate-semialdehyde dehydrogenase